MEYTYTSTDPDKYNEVRCPINYLGSSTRIKWTLSSINGKSNVVLLDTDDYATFDFDGTIQTHYIEGTYMCDDELPTAIEHLMNKFNITTSKDTARRYILTSELEFTLLDMSPRLRYATGFYYKEQLNEHSVFDDESITSSLTTKSMPFDYLTPIWYAISNLGTPNQVSSLNNQWRIYYPAIAAKITNCFTEGQALSIYNSDYETISLASSMSNLKIVLVDANLYPIKFLSPISVSIKLEEVPLDEGEQQAIEEVEENKDYLAKMNQQFEANQARLTAMISKLEKGLAAEPEYTPMEFSKEPPIDVYVNTLYDVVSETVDDIPGTAEPPIPYIPTMPESKLNENTNPEQPIIDHEQGMLESQELAN